MVMVIFNHNNDNSLNEGNNFCDKGYGESSECGEYNDDDSFSNVNSDGADEDGERVISSSILHLLSVVIKLLS